MKSDCLKTRNRSGPCSQCGARPETLHIPMHARGIYCGECCPECAAVSAGQTHPQVILSKASREGGPIAREAQLQGSKTGVSENV